MLFQGSGTLFNPMRGVVSMCATGIGSPGSTNKSELAAHRSMPLNALSILSALVSFAGPLHQAAGSNSCPPGGDLFNSFDWLDGADQDRRWKTVCLDYEVQAPVHAIGEVNIGMPRRSIHYLVARGATDPAVAALVVLA